MPKRMPVKSAKEVADKYCCRQVIICAWDGDLTHVVTYGKSQEDCAQAAIGGALMKKTMEWPEKFWGKEPKHVAKLKEQIEELKKKSQDYYELLYSLGCRESCMGWVNELAERNEREPRWGSKVP